MCNIEVTFVYAHCIGIFLINLVENLALIATVSWLITRYNKIENTLDQSKKYKKGKSTMIIWPTLVP